MAVLLTNSFVEYRSQGLDNEQFNITFDYRTGVSSLVVKVNDEVFPAANWNLLQRQNGSYYIEIQTGHTLDADDKVEIFRSTTIDQDITYVQGSQVEDKHIVEALDKTTLILQEMLLNVGGGTGEIEIPTVSFWYGLTGVQANALAPNVATSGPLAQAAFQVEANRTLKNNNDLIISPALVSYEAPAANGFYYAWVAVPNTWTNVFFFEGFRSTQLWKEYAQTVELNAVTWAIYVRIVPMVENQTVHLKIERYS